MRTNPILDERLIENDIYGLVGVIMVSNVNRTVLVASSWMICEYGVMISVPESVIVA